MASRRLRARTGVALGADADVIPEDPAFGRVEPDLDVPGMRTGRERERQTLPAVRASRQRNRVQEPILRVPDEEASSADRRGRSACAFTQALTA